MIGLIVARSKNNVIGKNGEIPWKIKGEQKQFKELTTGKTVVFGRKAFDEIGKPLPNRKTILVSSTKKIETENCTTISNLEEYLKNNTEDLYIAGGYRLFEEVIPFVDKMYITEVDIVVEEGDVFFPEFDKNEFDISVCETGGEEIKYTRTIYTRK